MDFEIVTHPCRHYQDLGLIEKITNGKPCLSREMFFAFFPLFKLNLYTGDLHVILVMPCLKSNQNKMKPTKLKILKADQVDCDIPYSMYSLSKINFSANNIILHE